MSQIEFKYSAKQQHQVDAVNAVCDLFRGQEFLSGQFTARRKKSGQLTLRPQVGHANGLHVSPNQLIENLHAIQEENSLPPTSDTTEGRLRDFTIEMETGTGKTYCYIRTIYELNRRYGLTKFVIVVPSVAIREGVKKSFESTRSHFDELYDRAPLDSFVYDSNDLDKVANFALSNSMQVMIINISAFNKELAKDEKKGVTNIFHRPSEKLVGGWSPQALVSECHPIVIIDEPQSVDNTKTARKAITSLNPLFVLRYSATHKQMLNLVYQLGPVDAFQMNLVKGIVVDSVNSGDDLNGAYVGLVSVNDKSGYSARVRIDVRKKRGVGQERKIVTVRTGHDLYQKSNDNSDYEDGWVVQNISTAPGNEYIEFQNGTYLEPGEATGDAAAEVMKHSQIVKTIEDHLERQLKLYPLGIKVLSLFFIDRVDKYRLYEPDVHNGEYADIFEQEYRKLASSDKWQRRYKRAGVPLPLDPRPLHDGYFAQDGRTKRYKDTREGAGTAADTSAFERIMQKKETLICLPDGKDPDKDVAFIFSHSALKEGWDNPNVFQICTLVETTDPLTKRQKIGRGLRLSVNQEGERSFDPDVNVLTVIASESYEEFASGLQKEFADGGYRFGVLTPQSFTKVVIATEGGGEERIGFNRSKAIYDSLVSAGMVTNKGEITPELKSLAETEDVPLPPDLADVDGIQEQVCGIVLHKASKLQIRDKKKQVHVELEKDVTADPAFQELWDRIRQTTKFEMHVDTEALIDKVVAVVKEFKIKPVQVISTQAALRVEDSGVNVDEDSVHDSIVSTTGTRIYDLPDPIAELQDAVGLTRATLAHILEESDYYENFRTDPMTFLTKTAEAIEAAKVDILSKGVKYTRLPESQWYTMDILAVDDLVAYEDQNAWKPVRNKSLYSYVIYDSSTIERPYAVALDRADQVKVFAKLPDKFVIDTPLGPYNPDWAYVEEVDGRERVYFVVETKGKARGQNRPREEAKITCAEKHFLALSLGHNFTYTVDIEYQHNHAK